MQYFRFYDCIWRHAAWRSSECQSAKANDQPAVLTTGALRSRLSLKYRRVPFGWFGCPAVHLYHHRSVTYGLSSLSSLRYPARPTLLHVLSIVYPTLSFPSVASLPFGHQPNSTLCPFFLSYSFASLASTANEPRVCQIQSHLPTHPAGSNLRAVLLFLSVLLANFSLFPSAQSRLQSHRPFLSAFERLW